MLCSFAGSYLHSFFPRWVCLDLKYLDASNGNVMFRDTARFYFDEDLSNVCPSIITSHHLGRTVLFLSLANCSRIYFGE